MIPSILLSIVFAATPHDAGHGHLPIWPVVAYAEVTETFSGLASVPAYQVRYGVEFLNGPDEEYVRLAFNDLRTVSIGGQPWNSDANPLGIFLFDVDIGWDGAVVGVHDEPVVRARVREAMAKTGFGNGASDLPQALSTDALVDQMLRAAADRYSHWMSGALEAPRKAGERRTHATRRLNGSVPTQARHETWFENDPAAPRERLLVMQSSTFEVPDGSHAPAEAADSVRPIASASAGVASPAESPGGHTTIHLLARTTFDRATLLPLKTQVDTDGGVGPLSRIASLTYEFQWEKDTFDKVQVGAREKGAEPVEHEPEPADAGGNRAPSVRLLQPPRYPLMAMLLGAQGEALVKVLVSPDGRALQVELDTTSRWGLLDLAAMDAVEHARFHPELVGGQAVESWTLVPIDFSLTDAQLQRYRLPQSVPTPTPSAESENDP